MNLYEIITQSRIDDSEAERISALLQTDNKLKEVIKKYSRETWNTYLENYQKKFEDKKLNKKHQKNSER